MHVQVIGTKKSKDTQKAERFFKERGVAIQFVDLRKRPLSGGELLNIARSVGQDALLDTESKEYQSRGLAYMEFDVLEELEEHPELLRVPVVRYGKKATVGYDPDTWQAWLDAG
jgi:arsenate reductase-like glutaredoxin family protein